MSLITSKIRKARKEHVCSFCGCKIAKGEKNLAHLFAATLDFLSVRLKTRIEAADKELKAREAKDGRPQ